MLNEQRKQEVTEICQKLIQNPSSSGMKKVL
uniref:Peptidase n=1 Tax=Clostridioides difficile TaxID=1496 RepID=A0A381ID15_CLODI|nr:peptidase [Clostridioides difficile]